MINSLLIAVHAFASRVLMSASVDETLLPRKVNLSSGFRELRFRVEMSALCLKHLYSVLSALTWPMPAATRSRLFSRVSAWPGVFFHKCYVISIVHVHNCLCRVSSASFLCQFETIIFHFINRHSKHVV